MTDGFEDVRCKVCGRIGNNNVARDEIVVGDQVIGHSHWLVCKCGHEITELEDYEGMEDEE